MTVCVVLRLVAEALVCGRLAGEAEIVETGERATVRDATDLLRFLTGGDERETVAPKIGGKTDDTAA